MLDARGIVVENGEIIGGKTESCFLLAPNGRESNAPKPAQAGAKKEQALADLLLTQLKLSIALWRDCKVKSRPASLNTADLCKCAAAA